MSNRKNFVWIRRWYGAFVLCKNEAKARRKAETWHMLGQGGSIHPVIWLFVGPSLEAATRTELYNMAGSTGK